MLRKRFVLSVLHDQWATIFKLSHTQFSIFSINIYQSYRLYTRAILTGRYSETLLQRLLPHTRIAAINDSTSDSIYIRRYIGTITVTGL